MEDYTVPSGEQEGADGHAHQKHETADLRGQEGDAEGPAHWVRFERQNPYTQECSSYNEGGHHHNSIWDQENGSFRCLKVQ